MTDIHSLPTRNAHWNLHRTTILYLKSDPYPPPGYDFSDIIKRIREQLDNYRRANNAYDVSCWDDTSKLGFKTVKFRCKNFNRYVAKYYPVVADSPEKIIAFLQFLGYRVASSEIYHIS